MAFVPSGKFDQTKIGAQNIGSLPNYDYCGASTTTDSYPASTVASGETTNKHEFGFVANTIIITNTGSKTIAFQWPRLIDQALDSGIVLAGSTLYIRNAVKSGILLKSFTAGQPSDYVISAV